MTFGGADSFRGQMQVDAESFIAVKGFKAKGKRVTTFAIDSVEELEPLRQPEQEELPEEEGTEPIEEAEDPDDGKSQDQVADEMNGQMRLFDE